MFPSGLVRFPGPGLKRLHPGTESKGNKPPEPVISQIIDKLKHINQVSFETDSCRVLAFLPVSIVPPLSSPET